MRETNYFEGEAGVGIGVLYSSTRVTSGGATNGAVDTGGGTGAGGSMGSGAAAVAGGGHVDVHVVEALKMGGRSQILDDLR